MNKKIGIIFGMENTFPPALVEKINCDEGRGSHGRVREGGRRARWMSQRVSRDHRPHLAGHSFLSRVSEERGAASERW